MPLRLGKEERDALTDFEPALEPEEERIDEPERELEFVTDTEREPLMLTVEVDEGRGDLESLEEAALEREDCEESDAEAERLTVSELRSDTEGSETVGAAEEVVESDGDCELDGRTLPELPPVSERMSEPESDAEGECEGVRDNTSDAVASDAEPADDADGERLLECDAEGDLEGKAEGEGGDDGLPAAVPLRGAEGLAPTLCERASLREIVGG